MHVKLKPAVIALVLFVVASPVAAASVHWQPDLQRARVLAAHSNRLVLIHFWGAGCPPCEWMEREVFSRPEVAQAIDQGFVAVKINKAQAPSAARQYGVAAVPSDVIITPQGQVLGSYVGRAEPDEFVARLHQVAHRAPSSANPNGGGRENGPAYQPAGPGQGAQYAGAGNQGPEGTGGYPMRGGPAAGTGDASAYGSPGMPAGGGQTAPVASRYSGPYAAGGGPAASQRPDRFRAGGSSDGPQSRSSSMGQPSQTAHNPYPVDRSSSPAGGPMQSSGTQMPPAGGPRQPDALAAAGNPPLALDGFCPVSLERTMREDPDPKWIPGDPRWGVRHEGRTYLFAGPQEQQAFLDNPDFYAPVLSGDDLVVLVEQGRQVPGVRKFGARWKDHVYLFSSRESFEKFQANPTFYESEIFGSSRQPEATASQGYGPQVRAPQSPPYGYR